MKVCALSAIAALMSFAMAAGWYWILLQNGEPLFSRRCANDPEARFVAESAKKDLLKTGWAEER